MANLPKPPMRKSVFRKLLALLSFTTVFSTGAVASTSVIVHNYHANWLRVKNKLPYNIKMGSAQFVNQKKDSNHINRGQYLSFYITFKDGVPTDLKNQGYLNLNENEYNWRLVNTDSSVNALRNPYGKGGVIVAENHKHRKTKYKLYLRRTYNFGDEIEVLSQKYIMTGKYDLKIFRVNPKNLNENKLMFINNLKLSKRDIYRKWYSSVENVDYNLEYTLLSLDDDSDKKITADGRNIGVPKKWKNVMLLRVSTNKKNSSAFPRKQSKNPGIFTIFKNDGKKESYDNRNGNVISYQTYYTIDKNEYDWYVINLFDDSLDNIKGIETNFSRIKKTAVQMTENDKIIDYK